MQRPYRVVVAEAGVDEQGLGARPLARALRDAGFEVVSLGIVDDAERVVAAAVQEDADAVALGSFAGAPADHLERVVAGLADRERADVRVFTIGTGPADPAADPPRFADGPPTLAADWLTAELEAGSTG